MWLIVSAKSLLCFWKLGSQYCRSEMGNGFTFLFRVAHSHFWLTCVLHTLKSTTILLNLARLKQNKAIKLPNTLVKCRKIRNKPACSLNLSYLPDYSAFLWYFSNLWVWSFFLQCSVVGMLQIRPIEKYMEICGQYDNADGKCSLFRAKGGAVFITVVSGSTILPDSRSWSAVKYALLTTSSSDLNRVLLLPFVLFFQPKHGIVSVWDSTETQ